MTTLTDLNRLMSATRVLAEPNSGYHPRVAVAISDLFRDYVQLDCPPALEASVMNLANALLAPLEVER
jgi:hypothetical protein